MFFRRWKRTTFSHVPGFDQAFYLKANPDVATAGIDPLRHFMAVGWKEGRDPNAHFSIAGYLRENPDVLAAGINPLQHFWQLGLAEGRAGWIPVPTSAKPTIVVPAEIVTDICAEIERLAFRARDYGFVLGTHFLMVALVQIRREAADASARSGKG